MEKLLYCLLIILSFLGCKYYAETLTLNDDRPSGKMEVLIFYDVAEAQKNKIERATAVFLKKSFAKFKCITLTAYAVSHKKRIHPGLCRPGLQF